MQNRTALFLSDKFVHSVFRAAVELFLGEDIAALFDDSSLHVIGERRKVNFGCLTAREQAVKVIKFSHKNTIPFKLVR